MTTLTTEQKQHLALAKQGKVDARDAEYLAVSRPTRKATYIGPISID